MVHEAAIVAELFRRYVEDGVSIAELARWLTSTAVPTRTGKSRWDRSVIWAMLRNPAYPGRACFGKTMRHQLDLPEPGRAAHILRDPDWGVGMLEDFAELVQRMGRDTANLPGDQPTWGRH